MNRLIDQIASVFAWVRSVHAVTAAVEAHRAPRQQDLQRLGIPYSRAFLNLA